jgi:hypothetical protein
MTFSAKEMIQKRKSVRTYAGRGLRPKDKAALEKYIQSVSNPFDVPVEFRLLRAKEYKLSSPVIVGEKYYIAAKLSKCKNFEIGYGYSFESMCLYAESLGLGTVILAGTLNRSAFEQAMKVSGDEVMPAATPVGYPAPRRSVRETLMRKGVKADERIPFEKLFFKGSFESGLTKEDAGIFADALEMTRWAPSAANKQPWRIVVSGDTVHFYEYKTLKDSPLGDVQKVDLGIALAHFDLTMQENGYEGRFIEADPGIELPENMHYIISYERTK